MKATRIRHLKKGDKVVALSGVAKGETGVVHAVDHANHLVQIELDSKSGDAMKATVAKKASKPTQKNPKGGIIEQLRWIPASKWNVAGANSKSLGRIGWTSEKDGTKKRVFSSERGKTK